MTDHDPTTGEIIDYAADGNRLVPAAGTLADFIRMLEDGQFDADVQFDLQELAGDMQNEQMAGNLKPKAKLTITVDIELEPTGNGPVFYFRAAHKITQASLKRSRSIAWATEDNRFTPNKPHQGVLFGKMRDVNARNAPARDVG